MAARYDGEIAMCVLTRLMIGDERMSSAAQKRKVEKVMHEYEKGDLKSSSGRKVRSRKQAVAIAMSESGQSKKRQKAS
jgi:hypothetical protein